MFENARVGDRVYHLTKGWGVIETIDKSYAYPIKFKPDSFLFSLFLTIDGKTESTDENPILFWEEPKLEYIKEKPFRLSDELKKLEVKEFDLGKGNCYLYYSFNLNSVCYCKNCDIMTPGVTYFTEKSMDNFMYSIRNKNVSYNEFVNGYKEVFGG